MKNLLLLTAVISMIAFEPAYSQIKCGTEEYLQFQLQDETFRANRQLLERRIKEFLKNGLSQRDLTIYRIPIVVHIVMENPNIITDDQIQSQIKVLNEDYRAHNLDIGNVPTEFEDLISDTQFEFYLANVGENCNGITRTTIDLEELGIPCFIEFDDLIKSTDDGGHDAIDPNHLLNIWVGPICQEEIDPLTGEHYYYDVLGYTPMPGNGPPEYDGVAIHPKAFGAFGGEFPSNKGRTATHEIGHYFDLIHIWGTTNQCDPPDDDDVPDTPEQDGFYFGCPSSRTSCNNGPNGDLINNFMQYVDDECMYMFTKGQSERMRAFLNTSRMTLIDAYTPQLSNHDIALTCSLMSYDLNELLNNDLPAGSTLVWSTDGDLSDGVSPILDSHVQHAGVYFAYFYNGSCYNGPSEAVNVHGQDMHITIDTDYPNAMEVFGNIFIENGATLTITSTISFGPDSRIFVEDDSKLVIDGGTLTACSDKWQGVKVAGQFDLGVYSPVGASDLKRGYVTLKNGAIIEKAMIGIDGKNMFVSDYVPSPQYYFGGGKITISTNSTIQHCGIGVRLERYGWGSVIGQGLSGPESSAFTSSFFNHCDVAIYSENNIGLFLSDNVFEENGKDYEGYNSSIAAIENDFRGPFSIMASEHPVIPGSSFTNNVFSNSALEIDGQ